MTSLECYSEGGILGVVLSDLGTQVQTTSCLWSGSCQWRVFQFSIVVLWEKTSFPELRDLISGDLRPMAA